MTLYVTLWLGPEMLVTTIIDKNRWDSHSKGDNLSIPYECSDERHYLQTLNSIEKGEWGNKEIFSCFKLGKTAIVPTI